MFSDFELNSLARQREAKSVRAGGDERFFDKTGASVLLPYQIDENDEFRTDDQIHDKMVREMMK